MFVVDRPTTEGCLFNSRELTCRALYLFASDVCANNWIVWFSIYKVYPCVIETQRHSRAVILPTTLTTRLNEKKDRTDEQSVTQCHAGALFLLTETECRVKLWY